MYAIIYFVKKQKPDIIIMACIELMPICLNKDIFRDDYYQLNIECTKSFKSCKDANQFLKASKYKWTFTSYGAYRYYEKPIIVKKAA